MSTPAPLLPASVAGLDLVLGGGLSRGSLIFLVGTSGAGKTVLGSQILFSAARDGIPVLILTAFAESHVKLVEHMSSFSFFDPDLVGTSVTLLSMQSLLGDDPDSAALATVRAIRESGACLVLIDGFQGLASLLPDRDTVRRLVASLAGQLPYLNVTMLVTLEGSARDPRLALELATADVVIGLGYRVEGWRHARRLEVVKQRGRAPLPGLHAYTITSGGITVFPRLEASPIHVGQQHATQTGRLERASFNLPELDALLGGGLTPRTITVLAAAPGVGKTSLGLHWALAQAAINAAPPRPAIYITFHEHAEQLRQKAQALGLPLDAALEQGTLKLIRVLPVEVSPDYVAAQIVDAVAAVGGGSRLVLDDLSLLLAELGSRARDFLSALKELLYHAGITSLFLLEIPPLQGPRLDLGPTPLSLIGETVIMVQQYHAVGTLHRILTVLKMRFSSHDRTSREVVFEDGQLRVLTPEETAPGVLSAVAASSSAVAEA